MIDVNKMVKILKYFFGILSIFVCGYITGYFHAQKESLIIEAQRDAWQQIAVKYIDENTWLDVVMETQEYDNLLDLYVDANPEY